MTCRAAGDLCPSSPVVTIAWVGPLAVTDDDIDQVSARPDETTET